MLKVMQAGLAHEARRLRREENKGYTCEAQQDHDKLDARAFYAKYGKFTLVQWSRFMRNYRRSLKPAQAKAVARMSHTRTHLLRRQARAVTLARAFLKGHTYAKVEVKAYSPPLWHEIDRLVKDNLPEHLDYREYAQKLAQWVDEGRVHWGEQHLQMLQNDKLWMAKQAKLAAAHQALVAQAQTK